MAASEGQIGLLEDLILEVMQSNEHLVTVDKNISLSTEFLNLIDTRVIRSNDLLLDMVDIMRGNNLAALEKAKEDGALQERMIKALEGIDDNTKEKSKAKELSGDIGVGGMFAFIGGMISGYISQLGKVVKGFFELIKAAVGGVWKGIRATFSWISKEFGATRLGKAFTSLIADISKQIDLVKDSIKSFFKASGEGGILSKVKSMWTSIKNFFMIPIDNVQKEFKFFKEAFGPMVARVKGLLAPILDIGARLDDVKGAFSFIKNTVQGWVKNVFSKIKNVLGILGGGDSILGKIGKFFGKFLAPVTFLLTLYDTVKGAIAGYEDGGILGAVKGGLIAFLSSFAGEILDMLKGVISWVASALGFENVSAALDGFSFMSLIQNGVTGIWDWFDKLFTDPGAALSELWNNLVGEGGLMDLIFKPINMLVDWITKKLGWRDEDAPEFSLGNVIRGIWNTIIEWVAGIVEKIPVVGGKGASMIRSMSAGEATVDIGEMSKANTPKLEKDAESTKIGDKINEVASDKRNTEAVAAAKMEQASATPAPVASGGGGGGSSVDASQSTVNISHGNAPDRTTLSVLGGTFGLSP